MSSRGVVSISCLILCFSMLMFSSLSGKTQNKKELFRQFEEQDNSAVIEVKIQVDSLVKNSFKAPFVIKGSVVEELNLEPVPFANVILESEDSIRYLTTTDFDGKYQLTIVKSGVYQFTVSYLGFKTFKLNNVEINSKILSQIDVSLKKHNLIGGSGCCVTITIPLIEIDNTTIETKFSREDILRMPY